MKAFKIPKEESAYVCVPIYHGGTAVDTSTLTNLSMVLSGSFSMTKQLTATALDTKGIAAKIEGVPCGSYTLRASGVNASNNQLSVTLQLEIVHYDSQVNVSPVTYLENTYYILDWTKEGAADKALDLRISGIETDLASIKTKTEEIDGKVSRSELDDVDADDVDALWEEAGYITPVDDSTKQEIFNYIDAKLTSFKTANIDTLAAKVDRILAMLTDGCWEKDEDADEDDSCTTTTT